MRIGELASESAYYNLVLVLCLVYSLGVRGESKEMSEYRVAIIGAGIAGCTAARTLIENGVNDVIILEATDRIGGRVRTITHEEGKKLA